MRYNYNDVAKLGGITAFLPQKWTESNKEKNINEKIIGLLSYHNNLYSWSWRIIGLESSNNIWKQHHIYHHLGSNSTPSIALLPELSLQTMTVYLDINLSFNTNKFENDEWYLCMESLNHKC